MRLTVRQKRGGSRGGRSSFRERLGAATAPNLALNGYALVRIRSPPGSLGLWAILPTPSLSLPRLLNCISLHAWLHGVLSI